MSSNEEKKTYKFEMKIVIKDCKTKFHPDFEPGVLIVQEVTYELTEKEAKSNMFIASVISQEDDFLKNHIEVVSDHITPEIKAKREAKTFADSLIP